jgi:hypothetical protein
MPTSSRSVLRPHLIADLTQPSHLTESLEAFRHAINCSTDNWERKFQKSWTASCFVDTVLVYVATQLAEQLASVYTSR